MNGCWPSPATGFPVPNRRRGRRSRTKIWQMHAGSEPLRASHHVQMVAWSSQRPLVAGIVQSLGSDEAIGRRPILACFFPAGGPVGRIQCALDPRRVEGIIKLVQQVPETVGNPLLDHIVVNSLEDIAEPSLVFAT